MNSAVVDRDGEMVLGFSEEKKLDSVLDFESTGRRETSARALHLLARGSHVSGFILRPDDGLSDVALVCNGATRFLSPAEFQWLMHESRGCSILVDRAGAFKEARAEADALLSKNMEQQAVIRSLREALRNAEALQ